MERDQFKRLWLKGRVFIEGVRILKSQAIVAFFVSRWRPLLLSFSALLLCLLIFQVVWQFFWVFPNQQLAAERIAPSWKRELTQKESYELQNNIRQTFLQALGGAAQALGGAALLLGLYFTARTLRISQETLRINQEALRVTQEGQITERFAQAIEHLGNADSLLIRLGGIYALERIARDSDKDHWPIMEVLTTYVRENAPWRPQEAQLPPDGQDIEVQSPEMHTHASSTAEGPALRSTPTAIQAILTVIGRRTRSPNREGEYRLDLHNTDLRSADLNEAHLERASLYGAHLEGASLIEAHLEEAFLIEAHLERASLHRAHLERASLYGAHLEGASLIEAHLEGASLNGAHLEGASLYGAHLEGASLYGAHLEGAILYEAHLEGADLREAHLEGADLREAHLEGASLYGAHLEGAILYEAHLERAFLTVAQLITVGTLQGASLDSNLKEEIQSKAPHLL